MEVLSAVLAASHHLDATADEILERDRNRIGIDAYGDEPTGPRYQAGGRL